MDNVKGLKQLFSCSVVKELQLQLERVICVI